MRLIGVIIEAVTVNVQGVSKTIVNAMKPKYLVMKLVNVSGVKTLMRMPPAGK